MTTPVNPMAKLLERARIGDQDAARELYDKFAEPIRRVIRLRLERREHAHRLRRVIDSADILQSVWADFFDRCLRRESFASPDELVAFLSQMARHKGDASIRKHLNAEKRSLTRQVALEPELANRLPAPQQAIDASDEFQHLLDSLPRDWEQQALLLLRDGHSQEEVAALLHIDVRTLRRLLERLRGC
jgi:RNA polymerase sigma factor (sigma-70 family)